MTPLQLLIKQALKTLQQTAQCQRQKPQRDKNLQNRVSSGKETGRKVWGRQMNGDPTVKEDSARNRPGVTGPRAVSKEGWEGWSQRPQEQTPPCLDALPGH